ncbi:hypothetical protein VTI74DRAFT_11477 [Chaetomium olivicolor]
MISHHTRFGRSIPPRFLLAVHTHHRHSSKPHCRKLVSAWSKLTTVLSGRCGCLGAHQASKHAAFLLSTHNRTNDTIQTPPCKAKQCAPETHRESRRSVTLRRSHLSANDTRSVIIDGRECACYHGRRPKYGYSIRTDIPRRTTATPDGASPDFEAC